MAGAHVVENGLSKLPVCPVCVDGVILWNRVIPKAEAWSCLDQTDEPIVLIRVRPRMTDEEIVYSHSAPLALRSLHPLHGAQDTVTAAEAVFLAGENFRSLHFLAEASDSAAESPCVHPDRMYAAFKALGELAEASAGRALEDERS